MAADAGAIYAQILIDLEELKKTGAASKQYFDKLAAELKSQGEKAGKQYVNGFGKAQAALNKNLNEFVSSVKAINPKIGEIGENIANKLGSIGSKFGSLGKGASSLLPVMGALAGGVGLAAMGFLKVLNASEKFRQATSDLKEELGRSFANAVKPVGDFFGNLIAKAVESMRRAEALKKAMKDLAENAEKGFSDDDLSANITKSEENFKLFSQAYADSVDRVVKARKALDGQFPQTMSEASLSGYMRDLDELKAAEKHLKEMKAAFEQAEKERGQILQRSGRITSEGAGEFQKLKTEFENLNKTTAKLRRDNAIGSKEEIDRQISALDSYIEKITEVAAKEGVNSGIVQEWVKEAIKKRGELLKLQEKDTGGKKEAERVNLLKQAQEQYGQTMAQIQNQKNAGYINDAEAADKRLAAENQYIESLSSLKNEYAKLGLLTDKQLENISLLEAAAIANASTVRLETEYHKELAALEEERLRNNLELAGLEKTHGLSEYQAQIELIKHRQEADKKKIEERYKELRLQRESQELTKEETDKMNALLQSVDQSAALQANLVSQRELNKEHQIYEGSVQNLNSAIKQAKNQNEEALILAKKETSEYDKQIALLYLREKAAYKEVDAYYDKLKAQRESGELTEDEIKEMKELKEKTKELFDTLREGVQKNKPKKRNLWEDLFGDASESVLATADHVVNAVLSVAQSINEIVQNQAQESIAAIDRLLEESNQRIEEQREAALEAAGFIEAQSAEGIQEKIDRAKESGDQILQYQLQRRQEEMRINEEYDAKAKAAEEKAARDKARVEYEAAKSQYAFDITQAIITGAQSILNAVASGWSIIGPQAPVLAGIFGGLATAAFSAQLSVLLANPPKPPAFENGGIVGGSSYTGDKVWGKLNSGELILNRAQQNTVAEQLAGEHLVAQAEIPLSIDGMIVARAMASIYNSGRVSLEKRAIRQV